MAPQASGDVEKVTEFIADFQGLSASLLEEERQEALRSQLRAAEEALKQADSGPEEIEQAKTLVKEAQAAAETAAEAAGAAAEELERKAEELANVQAELASAEAAHTEVEQAGAQFAKEGRELREAKASNEEVTLSSFQMLSDGTWRDEKAKAAAAKALQVYLEEVKAEKALVASLPGLGLKPEERGAFDKMTVEAISEVLAEKLRNIEEQLTMRAPSEKEANTELLGLCALVEVSKEKAAPAEGEDAAAAEALRAAKAATKAAQAKVTKLEKSLGSIMAKQKLQEEEQVARLSEASAALERLFLAAADSKVPAATENGVEAAEPEMKKARTEMPVEESVTKELATSPKPEFAVASPARARA